MYVELWGMLLFEALCTRLKYTFPNRCAGSGMQDDNPPLSQQFIGGRTGLTSHTSDSNHGQSNVVIMVSPVPLICQVCISIEFH